MTPLHQRTTAVFSLQRYVQVSANIARLGALGLDVHITEMDIACKPPCGADRLALQVRVQCKAK